MALEFVKMHGAGNDYVLVDGFTHPEVLAHGADVARDLADRRFGVGGDGLIVLGPSERGDVRMSMWNADGSRGAMCGNGLRLLAAFAVESGRVASDSMLVETDSGTLEAALRRDADGEIVGARTGMPPIEVFARPDALVAAGRSHSFWAVTVGNPHAVVFVSEDPERIALAELAQAAARQPRFGDGVNVEVVQVYEPDLLVQRTFERGSGETWACGSGATAAAMAAHHSKHVRGDATRVRMRGGEVIVHRISATCAELEGPVARVFRGSIG